MAWNNTRRATSTHTCEGGLKHSATCRMAFGRKDPSCPRCQELIAGAPARESFHSRNETRAAEYRLNAHCCCGKSELWQARCPSCGRPPYTD